MDYKPGKITSKNERTSQTTTQTRPQAPFSSSVKIVGDNVTEKDYEAFFEGFNSVNDILPWQEKQSWQEPTIQNPPYRPSVDGEPRIQNLPYRPSQEGGARITLYSDATPTYTQVKNTSQKEQETWWDKIKDYGEDLLPYISPVAAVGKALEPEIREIHYGRNQYNVDLPQNKDEAKVWDWRTVATNSMVKRVPLNTCRKNLPNGQKSLSNWQPNMDLRNSR